MQPKHGREKWLPAHELFKVRVWLGLRGIKFDPDQPRDEDGKWTSGGGGSGSAAASEAKPKPAVAAKPQPRLEGRLRGSNPSKERVAAWDKQITARQTELEKAGLIGGGEDDNLQQMSGALGAYTRAKEGIIPSKGRGFNFVYTIPDDEEEPKLEAAVATKYNDAAKVAHIDYAGGLTRDAKLAALQDATIRCQEEGAKRVEANIFSDDAETVEIYTAMGFKTGGETAGVVTMYYGEPTTPEEIEIEKQREERRQADKINMISNTYRSVAKDLDFDSNKIILGSNDDPHVNFRLNGREFKAAGVAYIKDPDPARQGTIKLFPDQIWGSEAAQKVTAHEIQHIKVQNALDKYEAEARKIVHDPAFGSTEMRDAVTGALKPEYQEKYPIYYQMEQAFAKYSDRQFAQSDGVSNYSREYWERWDGDQSSNYYRSAVHETLAEMAALKYTTGKFPDHYGPVRPWTPLSNTEKAEGTKRWRELYRTVEKIHQMGLSK